MCCGPEKFKQGYCFLLFFLAGKHVFVLRSLTVYGMFIFCTVLLHRLPQRRLSLFAMFAKCKVQASSLVDLVTHN